MYALTQLAKVTWEAIAWAGKLTGKWTWKLGTAPFILLYWFFKSLFLAVLATPGILWRLPIRGYKRLVLFRNWALAKIEYLQAESAKWKTTFNIIKSPYSILRGLGFNPQMAASLLIGTSVVTGGVVVNETVFSEPSFANGDSGIFHAPLDVPTFFSPEYNTLRVDLGTTPVKLLEITDVSVGTAYVGSALPSGATTTIDVGGSGAVGTFLYVGEMEFSKNRCQTLELADISVHTLNITHNASDGQSIAPSAGTIRNRAILGGMGMAADMSTKGGLYDRVWIQAPTSGVHGQIDKLTISNLYTKGGGCVLKRIRGGTLTITLNEIGGDSDLSTKAFQIGTDVKAANIVNTGNYEVVMAVPATQSIDQ